MSLPTAFGSRSPDATSRSRSVVTLGWRSPSRSCVDRRRPAASRRARRCRRSARSPARCLRRSPRDSVGSDAFGIWMVREASSKPCPKVAALGIAHQGVELVIGVAHARPSGGGEGRCAGKRQERAPVGPRPVLVMRLAHRASPKARHEGRNGPGCRISTTGS